MPGSRWLQEGVESRTRRRVGEAGDICGWVWPGGKENLCGDVEGRVSTHDTSDVSIARLRQRGAVEVR